MVVFRMISFFLLLSLAGFAHCNTNVLSVKWGESFCLGNDCISTIPTSLTIHGLWPGAGNQWCPHSEAFDITKLEEGLGLVNSLRLRWPSLMKTGMTNEEFWEHEWEKHGTCVSPLMGLTEYFSKTVGLLEDGKFETRLLNAGIVPGSKFTLTELENIAAIIQGKPKIGCVEIGTPSRPRPPGTPSRALSEFYFCVKDGGIEMVDCTHGGRVGENCDDKVGRDTPPKNIIYAAPSPGNRNTMYGEL